MSAAVRDALPADAEAQIAEALRAGDATCTVCDATISAGEPGPSVLALTAPDGRTRIRLAHAQCAESRLIGVDHLPTPPYGAPAADELCLTWVLAARPRRVPTVILVCDVDRLEQLDVGGSTLIGALRLDGWRGGDALEDLQPRHRGEFNVVRVDAGLWLNTPFGAQPLLLSETDPSSALLEVAARQGQILIVLGSDLGLVPSALDGVDARLRHGEAIAARVSFADARPGASPRRRRRGPLRLVGWP